MTIENIIETDARGEPAAQPVIELTVEVAMRGRTPLLMHAMTEEMLTRPIGGCGHRHPRKEETEAEKAERGLYKNEEGKIGIPTACLLSCLSAAGRLVPFEGHKMVTSDRQARLLRNAISIEEPFLVFPDDQAKWVVDVKRSSLHGAGIAIAIVRPRFDHWSIKATVTVQLIAPMTEAILKQLFLTAGRRVGLLSFRPANGGIYGQFDVVGWKEIKRETVGQA